MLPYIAYMDPVGIGSLLQTLEVENKDGSKVQLPFCHPAAFMHITIYLDEIGPGRTRQSIESA